MRPIFSMKNLIWMSIIKPKVNLRAISNIKLNEELQLSFSIAYANSMYRLGESSHAKSFSLSIK
jgi:hypothetical protein